MILSVLNRFNLDGKVAVVTGASSGLGVEFARQFAAAGADLVIVARRDEKLFETARMVEQIGRICLPVVADISDPDDCERVVKSALDKFDRVDVLVNNAGIGAARPATRETPDEFRQVIDVNLNGTYWMSQACGRCMKPGSSIVNIGSAIGLTSANLPQAAYASSKAALIGLTRDLAQQWTARKGIRVNLIAPGFFLTEMTAEYPDGYLDEQLKRVLIGRVGDPVELAAAALFLASEASSYVTGITLPVEGGLLTS
jgi:NAD(P)-dependent dehydrogenase (short-subunit alcohol dehydrogenase family)